MYKLHHVRNPNVEPMMSGMYIKTLAAGLDLRYNSVLCEHGQRKTFVIIEYILVVLLSLP